MHTTDQTRAQVAYQKVSTVVERDDRFKKKYSTQCRRFPALIQQCGLCQAVAFLQAKGGSEEAVSDFLSDLAAAVLHGQTPSNSERLAQLARTSHFAEYQWLTRHALATATWFKRYAEALLPKGED